MKTIRAERSAQFDFYDAWRKLANQEVMGGFMCDKHIKNVKHFFSALTFFNLPTLTDRWWEKVRSVAIFTFQNT
jgi:hypothetical protein